MLSSKGRILRSVFICSAIIYHDIISDYVKLLSLTLAVVVSFLTIFVDYILINLRLLLLTYLFINLSFIYQDNLITAKSQLVWAINFLPNISYLKKIANDVHLKFLSTGHFCQHRFQ